MGFRGVPMETCSSGEELTVKARKPYTITKQRERWTDEEHNRFLEALKLYGRAWQRIEEHIGTKTAVQIRSHAQKFFSKLEKEALSKGVPLGQALDIDIPPPRPKRKPSNPYPRKACMGTIPSSKEGNDESLLPSVISSCQNTALHLKNGACLEKPVDTESSERAKEVSENGNRLEVLTLFQDAPCASVSSVKKNHATPPSFRKFVPFLKEINHKLESDKASLTANENEELTQCTADCTDLDIGRIKRLHTNSQTKVAPMKMSPGHKQPHEVGILSNGELQGTRSNSKHVAFHSVEENNENSGHGANFKPSNVTATSSQAEAPVYSIPPFTNPSLSATPEYSTHPPLSSFHPELPIFPPFTLFHNNQEAYRSLHNISSTFSNFIMSTLLENPAAHSAACLASSFWPSVDGEIINSASEALNSGILQRQVNASPNMAAIAAATVAAATAWWATHGLFPFCHPPLSTGFSFASTPSATGPTVNNRSPEEREARKDDRAQLHRFQDEHILDPESPDASVMQHSSSKSLPLTSSDSDERLGGIELNSSYARELDLKHDTGFHDYGNKAESEKKLDSCSCGSNKSSSNERETKIVLEKDEENKEPEKQASFSETNCRRFRSSGSVNESWKEVSEEGRLAFQALFSREVLPQSFSPPAVEDGTTNLEKERVATAPPVNLNSKVCEDIVLDHVPGIESSSSRSDNNSDKSILTSESGIGKLKSNRTGFKPYKRCSMEAKESRATIGDEKNNKRSRLEGEASTR